MDTTVDVAQAKNCHCLAARRAARAITRLYEDQLRSHGLRATQFSILAALTLTGPTRVGELADLLGLERTSLTRSAATLQHRRLVGLAPSQDGREHRLRITPSGRRKLESAFASWQEAQELADLGLPGAHLAK